ncbi:G-protein coupled receptor 176 [Petromyzon marinus]|uniref:G-protein coupled receptor 176 n=1 Tax=Petromyzon marinus TaxID=7757 RepID=UPI003F708456
MDVPYALATDGQLPILSVSEARSSETQGDPDNGGGGGRGGAGGGGMVVGGGGGGGPTPASLAAGRGLPPDNTTDPGGTLAMLDWQLQHYRDFATGVQVVILAGSVIGNLLVLWSTRRTAMFKSVTSRFLQNLAGAGLGAGLACMPPDLLLSCHPQCCPWLANLPALCRGLKFAHRLFCSALVLSFGLIAIDRYYSVLYPLERKISENKARDLVVYVWLHAMVASFPVFGMSYTIDLFSATSCQQSSQRPSPAQLIYTIIYHATTVLLPIVVTFTCVIMIRRALSASQKKKVIIAALRTPQNTISIPYLSQREAELQTMLLLMIAVFLVCMLPYFILEVYRTVVDSQDLPEALLLTAIWFPKLPLLVNPLLYLGANKPIRKGILVSLAQLQRRYSRRNTVGADTVPLGEAAQEPCALRSGSQLLEMFQIGQQEIFKRSEEDDRDAGLLVGNHTGGNGKAEGANQQMLMSDLEASPVLYDHESKDPLPGTTNVETSSLKAQFGFGPFELPPQWLAENRGSKKRLLPPLGNTPEELIQSENKDYRQKCERKINRNNKVSDLTDLDL